MLSIKKKRGKKNIEASAAKCSHPFSRLSAVFFSCVSCFPMVDHTSIHRYGKVRRLPLFFSYETFNLARVALLAIVVMIVGFAWLSSFGIVADLSRGISGEYGDNARFSGVRGTRVVPPRRFSPISSRYPLNIIISQEREASPASSNVVNTINAIGN